MMQAFCQTTHGIALNVDGAVVAAPPSMAPTTRVVTTTGIVGTLTTSSASTTSRTLTSTAAPSVPVITEGSGGFMFPSSTGNSFAFPTSPAACGSQNFNRSGNGTAAQGISGGAIAGIIVGALVLLGLIGGLIYWFRSKKNASDMERLDVGPLPVTSQFNSSNPAYHTPSRSR
ncbi:hypothetical protein BJ741DRAFT_614855 [Chytriomyces cf. hyalinus JEL632]|nr:hypothetical protein BJ741DRAFT_614855 [Chytriomyces cf. hyalinus JEL632]